MLLRTHTQASTLYNTFIKTPKMSTKRKSPLSTPKPAKRERKAIDLDTKMKVLKQYEGLKKVNMIARELQLSHSTVSTMGSRVSIQMLATKM